MAESAEKVRVVEALKHFFKLRPVDTDNDDGDDSRQLDCWELKEPERAATWTTLWSPNTENIVFATSFKGPIKDPQQIDYDTKITEFDDESADVLKVFCSTTMAEPYLFTIVIDTVRTPFSICDLFDSLKGSSFNEIVKTLEAEIVDGKWRTKKGDGLKAKQLAFKLRNIVNAMGRAALVEMSWDVASRTPPHLHATFHSPRDVFHPLGFVLCVCSLFT